MNCGSGRTYKTHGLSIVSCNGTPIRLAADFDNALEYALPVEVLGERSFQLLAIWMARDPVHYVPNLVAILDRYRAFLNRAPTVVLGDFNASVTFDAQHPRYLFRTIAAKLAETGHCSAYHASSGEPFGRNRDRLTFAPTTARNLFISITCSSRMSGGKMCVR